MFGRIFGRRKSPGEGDSGTDSGIEAQEERPDIVNCDGFIVLDDTTSQLSSSFEPPPGYTVSGANAFLPYGLEPKSHPSSTKRSQSLEIQSAIDGIPFKLGSHVLLEGQTQAYDISAATATLAKINAFNWDDYEYSFQLERSIIQEFDSSEQQSSVE